jgi:hypothetical protein
MSVLAGREGGLHLPALNRRSPSTPVRLSPKSARAWPPGPSSRRADSLEHVLDVFGMAHEVEDTAAPGLSPSCRLRVRMVRVRTRTAPSSPAGYAW